MLCSRCGGKLKSYLEREVCPHCSGQQHSNDPPAWAVIARLSNLAEAGYFADWLEGEGIPARVHHRHNFSALEDNWNTTFELHVHAAEAERALTILREALSEEADDDTFSVDPDPRRRTNAFLMGSPLIWIILAGGLAYVLGRSGWAPAQREMQSALWHVVAESPPLWSEPRAGQPRRCLRYDAPSGVVVLDLDFDGDGQWDQQQRFIPAP